MEASIQASASACFTRHVHDLCVLLLLLHSSCALTAVCLLPQFAYVLCLGTLPGGACCELPLQIAAQLPHPLQLIAKLCSLR